MTALLTAPTLVSGYFKSTRTRKSTIQKAAYSLTWLWVTGFRTTWWATVWTGFTICSTTASWTEATCSTRNIHLTTLIWNIISNSPFLILLVFAPTSLTTSLILPKHCKELQWPLQNILEGAMLWSSKWTCTWKWPKFNMDKATVATDEEIGITYRDLFFNFYDGKMCKVFPKQSQLLDILLWNLQF